MTLEVGDTIGINLNDDDCSAKARNLRNSFLCGYNKNETALVGQHGSTIDAGASIFCAVSRMTRKLEAWKEPRKIDLLNLYDMLSSAVRQAASCVG